MKPNKGFYARVKFLLIKTGTMAIPDIIASLREDTARLPEYFADIQSSGKIVACLPCDFLPFEILRSQGIHPFVLPSLYRDNMHGEELSPDAVIAPECCSAALRGHKAAVQIAVREIPEGYGDASLAPWKAVVEDIVQKIKGDGETRFSTEALRDAADRMSALRRLVRGIMLVRREKPDALPTPSAAQSSKRRSRFRRNWPFQSSPVF
jgi:hypothetical protein